MTARHPLLTLFLAGATLLFALSCGGFDAAARPRNLVVVLVDTLRADRLGVYGYERDTSPNVDAFARESLLFANSRSQASCTFPSVNSILTSRSPALFLGQPGGALGIPEGIPSIAEILREGGYRTVAISGNPIVAHTPNRKNPTGGYGRGFEVFSEECHWRPAACVNRVARRHLRKEGDDRPLFLYAHYIDPHDPYRPPQHHRRRFAGKGGPKLRFVRRGDPTPIAETIYKGRPDRGATPVDLRHLSDLYDEEIAYFDSQFPELLAALREAGLLEDSILVFTADHGEEFLEHGHIQHCRTVYDSSIKTPLIVRVPGVAPRVVSAPVRNLDLVPTLLDYAGIETAGFPFEGRSLRPLIEQGEEDDPRYQLASQATFRSTSDGRFKLIHELKSGRFWLYDVAADPEETTDVLARERRSFHRLRETMTAWLARTEGEGAAGESVRKAEEAEARLKALGYLQ
ncbi:MAG TPA: sulfatase [Thermoanaerobaculia bacterium]|nr:sulfatase [Thermoanaerobaculia bacterium]